MEPVPSGLAEAAGGWRDPAQVGEPGLVAQPAWGRWPAMTSSKADPGSMSDAGRPYLAIAAAACPRWSVPFPAAQLLGHQEAAQVTLARAAWPLRLGWKKSRVLTWLALNW